MNEPTTSDPSKLAGKAGGFAHPAVLSLLLAVVTLAVYWRALGCEFIDYDDPEYFSNNPQVQAGLSWSGIRWAFTTGTAANWHPVTWLSLMLDATVFGGGPAGPHLTNVLLHLANALLLFWLLRCLTGNIWPSAAVAALFAWHPLHVESVAWVAERKDVLSAFFFLLTLWAYAQYVTGGKQTSNIQHSTSNIQRPMPGTADPASHFTFHASRFYWLALLFFALGLMSKPMLVTLPFLLLLLDYWPIQRLNRSTIPRLLSEKLPFFLLSAASCAATFVAQHQGGAVVGLTRLSVSLRVENAFLSCARYLGKTFWPAALANPYPHPEFWLANPPPGFWSAGQVWLSVALFAGLSIAAVRCWRKFPFVTVGWFWFVGTLIPVIGLVQVGTQSMADRYTYLPLIGVFIALCWGIAEMQARWRLSRRGVAVLAAALLAVCAARARTQTGYWQNDGTLFAHALTVTRNNYVACVKLGTWHSKNGQLQETLDCYYQALSMNPSDPSVLYDVGNAFAKIGRWDEAIDDYRRALQIAPNEADILNNLGFALATRKQFSEAITHFEAALKLKPDLAGAHNNLAAVLYLEHRFAEAAQHYRDAIRLMPDDPRMQVNLGDALVRLGQPAEAGQCYREALRLKPGDSRIEAKLQALGAPISN